jgi:hypothetical protein
MKTKSVEIGKVYMAKVSGKLVRVRIDSDFIRSNGRVGFKATNLSTGRELTLLGAGRLRYEPPAKEGEVAGHAEAAQALETLEKELAGKPATSAPVLVEPTDAAARATQAQAEDLAAGKGTAVDLSEPAPQTKHERIVEKVEQGLAAVGAQPAQPIKGMTTEESDRFNGLPTEIGAFEPVPERAPEKPAGIQTVIGTLPEVQPAPELVKATKSWFRRAVDRFCPKAAPRAEAASAAEPKPERKVRARKVRAPKFDATPVLTLLKDNPAGLSTSAIRQALEAAGLVIHGKRQADRAWSITLALRAIPDQVEEAKLSAGPRARSVWKIRK